MYNSLCFLASRSSIFLQLRLPNFLERLRFQGTKNTQLLSPANN